jgi:hypothetical protein
VDSDRARRACECISNFEKRLRFGRILIVNKVHCFSREFLSEGIMTTVLSPEQVNQFIHSGYCVLEAALS